MNDPAPKTDGGNAETPGSASEASPGQSINVVLDADDDDPPCTTWLRDRLADALRALGARAEQLDVIIVGDATMRELHKRFMADISTTDVLTFDYREPRGAAAGPLEADVFVCLDEARREAADRDHDAHHELLLYALHGVLHLLGHDDHDPADRRAMHREEDRVLEAIGVGRIYASSD